MKNIIQEEIERIKLLSKYDNRITLTENKNLILEFNPKLINLLRKIKGNDTEVLNTLKKLESKVGFNKGSISLRNKNNSVVTFKDADDVIKNLDKLDSVGKANLISDL